MGHLLPCVVVRRPKGFHAIVEEIEGMIMESRAEGPNRANRTIFAGRRPAPHVASGTRRVHFTPNIDDSSLDIAHFRLRND